jgi:hypothetical protein
MKKNMKTTPYTGSSKNPFVKTKHRSKKVHSPQIPLNKAWPGGIRQGLYDKPDKEKSKVNTLSEMLISPKYVVKISNSIQFNQ